MNPRDAEYLADRRSVPIHRAQINLHLPAVQLINFKVLAFKQVFVVHPRRGHNIEAIRSNPVFAQPCGVACSLTPRAHRKPFMADIASGRGQKSPFNGGQVADGLSLPSVLGGARMELSLRPRCMLQSPLLLPAHRVLLPA